MSTKTVYVALQSFCEENDLPLRMLEEAGFEVKLNRQGRRLTPEELLSSLQGAHAVIAGVEPYPAQLLRKLTKLRCISRCGVGVDSIDLEEAKRLKIAVLTTPDEVVEPVAELTLAMILALARNLPLHQDDFHLGLWTKRFGHLLSEWTVGLIGYGRIGQAVERFLRFFGPKVVVTDPRLRAGDSPGPVRICSLSELLEQSDLVSLHANRPPEEGPILGRNEIFAMKKGGRLINTARGHLVDEAALAEALQSGHLAAAGLDVFQTEPYTGPLAGMSQVLLTPHIASFTHASRARMELQATRNLIRFFKTASAAEAIS